MNMTKKVTALLLALMMVLSLAACGGNQGNNKNDPAPAADMTAQQVLDTLKEKLGDSYGCDLAEDEDRMTNYYGLDLSQIDSWAAESSENSALDASTAVVLKVKACRECQNDDLREGVHDLISSLKRFFGPEEFKKRIHSRVPEGAHAGSGASKRTAFEGAMSTVKRGAEELLSDIDKQGRVSHYRAILLETLREISEEERPEVTWLTLTEDGNCRGCEICSKMCPHGAIELRIPEYAAEQKRREVEREVKRRIIPVIVEPSGSDSSDEVSFTYQAAPAGTSTQALNEAKEAVLAAIDEELARNISLGQALVHDASRCTQCGLCYMSCPEENIGGWAEITTRKLPAKVEHGLAVQLCEKLSLIHI